MTASRPPAHLIGFLDRALCLVAWASQVSAAAIYLAVLFQPAVWRSMFGKDPFSTVCAWMAMGATALLWMICLRQEQVRFYDRAARRIHRKLGCVSHGILLIFTVLAAAESPDRFELWFILGICAAYSTVFWNTWMHTRMLPPEDQAIIDAITARQAQEAADVYDATERELRRERLSAAIASLGYEPTDAQPDTSNAQKPAAAPMRWKIPPGKHAPLVYFISNGNRIKIGTTTELKRRIRTLALRPENVALLLDGDTRLERELHRQFANLRIGTTEWFAYDNPLLDYVNTETDQARKEQSK